MRDPSGLFRREAIDTLGAGEGGDGAHSAGGGRAE
jgi:hypothetical protein